LHLKCDDTVQAHDRDVQRGSQRSYSVIR